MDCITPIDGTPFGDLIERGDLESIEDLKRNELNLFQTRIELYGAHLMKCAISHNHFQIAEYLLENNCTTQTDDDDPPLLHQVATNPKATSFIQKLLSFDIDVNETDFFDYTPLHWACGGGVGPNVELLLVNGAKCDVRNTSGEAPLHLAVRDNHVDCVRLLLEAGADANIRIIQFHGSAYVWRPPDPTFGPMPLDFMMDDVFDAFPDCNILDVMRALCSSSPFLMDEVLLNLKSLVAYNGECDKPLVNWNQIERQLQIIALLLKFGNESRTIEVPEHAQLAHTYTKCLLEFGANPNFNKEDGSPPLIQAFRRNDFGLAKLLMKHGSDPNIVAPQLSSLLMDELKQHYPSFKYIDLLLELGADVNAKNSPTVQRTPLHMVTNYSYHLNKDLSIKLLEKLAERSNDIDPRDSEGYTPLMRAASSIPYNIKLLKSFLELKADPSLYSNRGHTLVGIAIHRYDPHLLTFFMEYGLNIDMGKLFNSSRTISALIDMNIHREKDKLLTARKFYCSERIKEERRLFVESFILQTFPDCSSNVFDILSCFLINFFRGSSFERKFCCTISKGASTFFVEAENYLLRSKSAFLTDYDLAGLLSYRLEIPQSDNYRNALEKEICSLESHVVWSSRTMFHLLQSDVDKVAYMLKNVELNSIDAILSSQLFDSSTYPIMSAVIEKHMRDVISNLNLLRGANTAINLIFSSTRSSSSSSFCTLPDHIVDTICSLLSYSDFHNLIVCCSGMNEDLFSNLKSGWWDKLNCLVEDGAL